MAFFQAGFHGVVRHWSCKKALESILATSKTQDTFAKLQVDTSTSSTGSFGHDTVSSLKRYYKLNGLSLTLFGFLLSKTQKESVTNRLTYNMSTPDYPYSIFSLKRCFNLFLKKCIVVSSQSCTPSFIKILVGKGRVTA